MEAVSKISWTQKTISTCKITIDRSCLNLSMIRKWPLSSRVSRWTDWKDSKRKSNGNTNKTKYHHSKWWTTSLIPMLRFLTRLGCYLPRDTVQTWKLQGMDSTLDLHHRTKYKAFKTYQHLPILMTLIPNLSQTSISRLSSKLCIQVWWIRPSASARTTLTT